VSISKTPRNAGSRLESAVFQPPTQTTPRSARMPKPTGN
jgi:hypothetical protein